MYPNMLSVKCATRKPHFTNALYAERICALIADVVIIVNAGMIKQNLAKEQNKRKWTLVLHAIF